MTPLPFDQRSVRPEKRDQGSGQLLRAVLLVLLLAAGSHAPIENRVNAQEPGLQGLQPGLRGPQAFVTILCKFADVADEPEPRATFERFFGSTYPGLDHYWREVSYGAINLAGSKVVGWYALPLPQAAYKVERPADANLRSPLPTADLQRLAEDCTTAAGSAVDWSRYVGLNLVFNARLDQPRGGQVCLQRDRKALCYGATWLWPPTSLQLGFWAHEMGHTFGLAHSSVGGGNEYGNQWDVMSEICPCEVDSKLDPVGQHPAAFQKDALGWIPAGRKFVAEAGAEVTIPLEQLAQPGERGYLLAEIPIRDSAEDGSGDRAQPAAAGPGKHYYTVEARRRVGYDATLPGDGVIIQEVNLDGDPRVRPVSAEWPVAPGGARTGLAARWTPGEVFRDAQHNIAVSIDRATPTGFVVTIRTRPLPPVPVPPDLHRAPPSELPEALRAALVRQAQVTLNTAADERGGTYIIWTEREADPSGGLMIDHSARREIFSSDRPAGGNWEPRPREIFLSYRPAGGSWGPRAVVNQSRYPLFLNPALAVDRHGNAYVAWIDYHDDQTALYIRRLAGGRWDEPIRLDHGEEGGYLALSIAIDGQDAAHVSWEGFGRCGGGDVAVGW